MFARCIGFRYRFVAGHVVRHMVQSRFKHSISAPDIHDERVGFVLVRAQDMDARARF